MCSPNTQRLGPKFRLRSNGLSCFASGTDVRNDSKLRYHVPNVVKVTSFIHAKILRMVLGR